MGMKMKTDFLPGIMISVVGVYKAQTKKASTAVLTFWNKKGKHCCPYILAALNACEEDICNVKNVEKWSSSRNALQGYTRFADSDSAREIKLQQAAETGKVTLSVRYVSDNNIQTCNVDWEQDCDLIDFLKDKIREIISPQAAASQTPHPAADSSPYSKADTLPQQNGD